MSLIQSIDRLAAIDGVLAVAVNTPQNYRGPEEWLQSVSDAMALFSNREEPAIRVALGTHTIMLQREGDQVAALVVKTGHAVAKSAHRFIRRWARPAGRQSDRAAAVDEVLNKPEPDSPAAVADESLPRSIAW